MLWTRVFTLSTAVLSGWLFAHSLCADQTTFRTEGWLAEADRCQMPPSTDARMALLASESGQAAEFTAALGCLRVDTDVLEASMVELIAKSKQ